MIPFEGIITIWGFSLQFYNAYQDCIYFIKKRENSNNYITTTLRCKQQQQKYSCDCSHFSRLQCHMILQKTIWRFRTQEIWNISYYQCWKYSNIWNWSKPFIKVVLKQKQYPFFRTTLMTFFDPLQMLTTVVVMLNILVETMILCFRILWWIESSKNIIWICVPHFSLYPHIWIHAFGDICSEEIFSEILARSSQ